MPDPLFTETTIDLGTLLIVAEILRFERGEEVRDLQSAATEIAAACDRLGGARRSKPHG